jgi:hypothetical protein
MHRHRIWIKRIVSARACVYAETDSSAQDNVSSHRRSTGSTKLAFDPDGLRAVSWFTHRYGKALRSPQFDEFRWRDAILTGGESDIGARWVAHYAELFVNAARNRRAGCQADEWEDHETMSLHNR